MGNVVPQNSGVTITGLLYQYKVNKQTPDDLTVTIRNQDTQYGIDPLVEDRYILSHTDDWSGRDPETIRRIINGMRLNGLRFGNGEIVTEGEGSVSEADIRYMFNTNPCWDPLYDPTCPGYDEASMKFALQFAQSEIENVNDPFNLTEVQDVLNQEASNQEDIDIVDQDLDEETDEKMNEMSEDAGLKEYTSIQQKMYDSLVNVHTIDSYYIFEIPGGEYIDNEFYDVSEMSDNATAMKSLATDNVHRDMVRSQYRN